MERARLEAFSDGVLAIAITLLVLEIKVPAPRGEGAFLAQDLAKQWPSYVAYLVSFLTIGVIWINHHATLRRLREVDHMLLFINLLLLLMVCIVPWTTDLLAEYMTEPHGSSLAAAIYGGSFVVLTAAFYAMQRHILFSRSQLLHARIDEASKRTIDRRGRAGLIPYVVATLAGFASAYLTLAICAAIAIYYALPSTIYERHSSVDSI